jgi:hypothetical protein
MKTLSETELARVIEALGVPCERISHTVADEGGSGAELDLFAPEPPTPEENDGNYLQAVRDFRMIDKVYGRLGACARARASRAGVPCDTEFAR